MSAITNLIAYSEKHQNEIMGLGIAYDCSSLISAFKSKDTSLAVESVASITIRTLGLIPAFSSDPTLKVVLLNINISQSCYHIYKSYNQETSKINRAAGLTANLAFFTSQLHALVNTNP